MDTRRRLRSSKTTTLVETTHPNNNDKEEPVAAFSDVITCSDCGRKLGDHKSLRRHMRLHTGEKPYKCDSCQESFYRSDQLKAHELTHFHMCFPCGYCKIEFQSQNVFNIHMENVHSNLNNKNPLWLVKKKTPPPPLIPMPRHKTLAAHFTASTHPPPLQPRPTISLNATEEENKLRNCSNDVPANGYEEASTDTQLAHMVVQDAVKVHETSQNSGLSPDLAKESQMNEEQVDYMPHSLQFSLSPDVYPAFADETVKSQILRDESAMRSHKLENPSQDSVLPSTHEQIQVAPFACNFLPMRFRQKTHLQQHLEDPYPIEDIWNIADTNIIGEEPLVNDFGCSQNTHGSDAEEEAQLCEYGSELHQREIDMNDRIAYVNRTITNQSGGSSSSSTETDKLYTCKTCGMSFLLKKHLLQHLQNMHSFKLPLFQCKYCPKSYHIRSSLVTHRRRRHVHNQVSSAHGIKFCNK